MVKNASQGVFRASDSSASNRHQNAQAMEGNMRTHTRGSILRVFGIATFVACGAITFGMDSGALGGLIAMPAFQKQFGTYDPHTKTYAVSAYRQLQFNVYSLTAAIMASLISGQFGSRLGRRTGLAATGVAGVVGAAISFAATDYKIMICGKVFTGLVYGFASNFVTSYNAEIAPASLRGVLVSLYQLGICVGHIVAAAINYHCYTLKTSWAWKGPFLSQMVPPAILALGIWFFPESPRWYMIKGRRDDAHRAIRRISGPAYTDDAIIAELDIIEEAIKQEREASHGRSWSQIFEGTNRRRTLLGICLQFLYVYSGPSFITSYGTYFLKVSGVGNAFMVSVILQVMGFVGTLIALPSVAYFRRRSILLAGGASEAICMFAFAIVGTAAPGSLAASKTLAAFTILYYCIVCATWSPLSWVVCCELPSNALRPKTVGAFSGLNWMLTLSMAIWLPYALNPSIGNLGAKLGFVFGPVQVVGVVWVYFFLPETSSRTLEELDALFFHKVPARKFAITEAILDGSSGSLPSTQPIHSSGMDEEIVDKSEAVQKETV